MVVTNSIRRNLIFSVLLILIFSFVACSKSSSDSSSGSDGGSTTTTPSNPVSKQDPSDAVGKNTVSITMSCGYVNEPCVSVTICKPGFDSCQTIDKILLDTGSYGLRVFSSQVKVALTQVTDSAGKSVARCVSYGDGSSQWGPVKYADVTLGGERASNIPIQIIDSTYPGVPSDCTNLDTDPSTAGFNGILGVGLFKEDCGSTCVNYTNNRQYFGCSGSTCSSEKMPLSLQVVNPVAMMPLDNNGVSLTFGNVPDAGATSLSGTMLLGIATQTNNAISGVTAYAADSSGSFQTIFNGTTSTSSFIDSGSNGLYFPKPSSLTACSSSGIAPGFYCPASTTSFSAVVKGTSGSPSATINFKVINAEAALASSNPNVVFNNLSGSMGSSDFDWGLPFFLGRTVFVQMENTTTTLGSGPLWAF